MYRVDYVHFYLFRTGIELYIFRQPFYCDDNMIIGLVYGVITF